MTNESFSISELIPARPEQIYDAWMNSQEHTTFTGDTAKVDAVVGGEHSSFNGYAHGTNVELMEGRRIVQTWRTTQFPAGSPDSRLEVTLEETVGGTMVTILHTDIPSGQADTYRQGWEKYYLEPLKRYFNLDEEEAEKTEERIPVTADTTEDVTATAIVRPKVNGKAKKAAAPVKTKAKKAARKPTKKVTKAATKKAVKKPPKGKKTKTANKAKKGGKGGKGGKGKKAKIKTKGKTTKAKKTTPTRRSSKKRR